jgi:hypothetical protein
LQRERLWVMKLGRGDDADTVFGVNAHRE